MGETWNKKEREKKKQKEKRDKAEKMQERKEKSKDGKSFDDMIGENHARFSRRPRYNQLSLRQQQRSADIAPTDISSIPSG